MTARPAVLGFDPGQDGGAALVPLDDPGAAQAWRLPYLTGEPAPDSRALVALILGACDPGRFRIVAAGVEVVSAFGMPPRAAFSFGRSVEGIRTLCALCGWRIVDVLPREWQRTVGCTGKARKEAGRRQRGDAIDAAGPVARLFPLVDLRSSDRARKPHSGIVDALAIAEHVRRLEVAHPFG